ncbi:MAG: hypothetical protein JKY01_01650 [Pseudomonadales bacterium]|nr:hypothetical protein [Pseudomonadales bacterium]
MEIQKRGGKAVNEEKTSTKESEEILIALDQVEQTIEVMCDTLVRLKEKVNMHLGNVDEYSEKLAQMSLEESVAPKKTMH